MVDFSELAMAGIRRGQPIADRAKAWKSAITLHLLQPTVIDISVRIHISPKVELYVLPI